MDKLLQKYDLKKATESEDSQMEEVLNEWMGSAMEDTVTKAMVLKALDVLQAKVCVEDFPDEDSPGGNMARRGMSAVTSSITYLIEENKATGKDFHGSLRNLLLKLFSCGPGSTHLCLIKEVFDNRDDAIPEAVDKDFILKTFDVMQAKVCVDGFPSEESPAGEMVKEGFTVILGFISALISDKKATPSDFNEAFTNCVLKLISSGPGTTHLAVIKELFGADDVDFSDYFKTLKGDNLKSVLAVCTRRYRSTEKIDYDEYADWVMSGMACVLKNGMTEKQVESHRAEFLHLYMYFQYAFMDCSDQEMKLMARMAAWIYDHMDGKPLKGSEEYIVFLDRLKELVLDKKFPNSTAAVKHIARGLESVFNAMKKAGNLKDLYSEMMDFAAAVFDQKAGTDVHEIVKMFGNFFDRVPKEHVKGNGKMFEGICMKLTLIVDANKDQSFLAVNFADAIVDNVLVNCVSNSADHKTLLIRLIVALIKVPLLTTMEAAYHALNGITLNWKENINESREIFTIISRVAIPEGEDSEDISDKYTSFIKEFLAQIKKCRLQQELNDGMVDFVLGILETKNIQLFEIGGEVADCLEFDARKNKQQLMSVFRCLESLMKDDSWPWMEDMDLFSLVSGITSQAITGVKNSNLLNEEDYAILISLVNTCARQDLIHPEIGEAGSIFYIVFIVLATNVFQKLTDINEIAWAAPAVGAILDLLDHEPDVASMAETILQLLCQKTGAILGPYMDKLVTSFLEQEKYSLLSVIVKAYPSNPKPVDNNFEKFMSYHDTGDLIVKTEIYQLYQAVAVLHPQLFTEKNLGDILKEAMADERLSLMILVMLVEVAKRQPDRCGEILPEILAWKNPGTQARPIILNVLKQIGVRSKRHSAAIMDHCAGLLEGPEEETLFISLIDAMRNVGSVDLELLRKHRAVIENVKGRSKIQYVKDGMQGLIDIIEGRSLATVSDDVKQTQEDVKGLDTNVKETDHKVKVISKEVDQQKKDIKTVKADVEKQDERVNQLEETVDETVAKVEELDSKTLSHAPFWSRDVSKLLNPQDEHDWRLLSSRLGYSNDDIRGWSQQHDPCMALLNEWYASRKTSEASFAILTTLQEMNRMDAAIIVENAMKMAETVVEDEPFEYATPPAVFLSYQWGIQDEVKLLKQHLEKAGFACWMDIGQMGGGDKLFEKIDQGIRASKVTISCVTEKYAKSPNCNREVNLSVSLGRPIIPLLMEKQTWPPLGSMGPIFSEYLFIRFFTRSGEETRDNRYWAAAKFQELLMQLNYNGIVPDEASVEPEYHNWWMPMVEEIKIEKKKQDHKTSTKPAAHDNEVAAASPDVFISYQWGKQKQIVKLYRRLTELGISCWLDIHQMGGGDSLYDKIDRGVRGCKVVLSCITTKYSLSANCRREVSLADALKKPIVPLLLEQITWPPSGPMSMVFTQLLYINFSKEEKVQESWKGKEFEELISKINSNLDSLPPIESKAGTVESGTAVESYVAPTGNAGKSASPNTKESLKQVDSKKEATRSNEKNISTKKENTDESGKSKSCTLL